MHDDERSSTPADERDEHQSPLGASRHAQVRTQSVGRGRSGRRRIDGIALQRLQDDLKDGRVAAQANFCWSKGPGTSWGLRQQVAQTQELMERYGYVVTMKFVGRKRKLARLGLLGGNQALDAGPWDRCLVLRMDLRQPHPASRVRER